MNERQLVGILRAPEIGEESGELQRLDEISGETPFR